jgi:hypothetical protein
MRGPLLATASKPTFRQRNHIVIPHDPRVMDRRKRNHKMCPQMQETLNRERCCGRKESNCVTVLKFVRSKEDQHAPQNYPGGRYAGTWGGDPKRIVR